MKINYDGINYNVGVKGDGLPLIFLHGFSESINTFEHLIEYLNLKDFKVILIDLIGHGKTDSPKDMKYYTLNHLLKAINFIVKSVTGDKYILYGYSMGGRIALAYSFIYKDEIRALILESASYGEVDKLKRRNRMLSDYKLAENIKVKGIQWFESYWSSLPIFKSQNLLEEDIKNKIKTLRLKNNADGLSKALIGFSQGRLPCLKNEILKLNLNILYISGELDKKYNTLGEQLANLNSKVKHVTVKSSGHNIHMEKPMDIYIIIKNFIRMGEYE